MSSSPETEADKECHFFKLAPEIRLTIYELAIESSPPAYFLRLGHLPIRPALVATNRLIRSEAMKTYYQHLTREFLSTSKAYLIEAKVLASFHDHPWGVVLLAHYRKYNWEAYTGIQDACLRASAALRVEDRRLEMERWPIKKWSHETCARWTMEMMKALDMKLSQSQTVSQKN